MRRTFSAACAAPAEVAWPLYAEPARWHEWAPHLRGAWGLGSPEVEDSRTGAARLLGVVPVPARIVHVTPGRAWTWRVGLVTMTHAVVPLDEGCRVSITLAAPGPLGAAVAAAYGPVCAALMRRLARAAEGRAAHLPRAAEARVAQTRS